MRAYVCVHMYMHAPFFGEDPTTRSIRVKYPVSFCFANQNIKAQSQRIPKYQKEKNKSY